MKFLVSVIMVCLLSGLRGQYLDTLHEVFKHKSSIDARLETRYSFINNKLANISGVRLGVAFQKKLRLGGGISWLKSDYRIIARTDLAEPLFFKFGYMCFYLDFVFHKTKRWQLSVPIQTGVGLAWYQRSQEWVFPPPGKKHVFALYEPGITVQFKVFRWFGLGSDVAYRFTLKGKKIDERLYSPTYAFKVMVWFDQLFYVIFPNSKVTKKYGPAVW